MSGLSCADNVMKDWLVNNSLEVVIHQDKLETRRHYPTLIITSRAFCWSCSA